MIGEAIKLLSKRVNLTYQQAGDVMDQIMRNEASPVQMSAYLTALAVKGETIEEITGSAAAMRKHCTRILHDLDVLEIVGTGGDGANSFNISTTSAIVAAAGGVPIAKHGNRSASGRCGSADVLEELGVNLHLSPEQSIKRLQEIQICFLFAQNYYLSMKYVAPVRKELKMRTIFNILGPLINPAGANLELIGVYEEELVEPIAQVIANLGVKRAMVVYGQDGLDEISISAPTTVCEVKEGGFSTYQLCPEQFGMKRARKEELEGGDRKENARITKAVLAGEKGAKLDAVCLNSGAALYLGGVVSTVKEGVVLAQELIQSGKAKDKLEAFIGR